MIFEGLKLAVIGILVVFSFLILLVCMVYISNIILKPFTEKEKKENMIKKRKKPRHSVWDNGKIMAIISAAIATHRFHSRA